MGAALREARFDDGQPVEAAGLRLAEAAAGSVPAALRVLVSPSARCRETAAALGLDAVVAEDLSGLDVGRWRGATLAEVGAEEPDAVGQWLADPASAPHGGESVRALCERVAAWLEAVSAPDAEGAATGTGADSGSASASASASTDGSPAPSPATATAASGRIIAVVEPEIVRAAVVRALGAPESAFWRLDVPPLTATELSGRAGRWNLRVGRALGT
ncbi:phosphoglycerate mutase [Streptomyces fructofermentans]|uniref:Phosphoglycerate mutase n=2 Tax=Streptomyces fructofermentans TaxID=152141 RepID=A0A918NDA4_9ACTN|nr:phosphoglycerate mutase [Streptomyces fructofermentans]